MRANLVLAGVVLAVIVVTSVASAFPEEDMSGVVTRVVDGDTFYVGSYKVRLADVNAPELSDPEGQEAKEALTALISGKTVILDVDDISVYGPYGRVIAVAFLETERGFLNVNKWLLENGYAELKDYYNEFDPGEWTLYVSSVEERTKVFINEVELNPEGDDRLSTVEEWVELYNPNDFAVSLEGWELRTTHGVTAAVKLSGSIPARGFLVVGQGRQWLDNEDEGVLLYDGELVDLTPKLNDGYNDEWTWQRVPDGAESWKLRPESKGESNSPRPTPSVSISTDKFEYHGGEPMLLNITLANPGEAAGVRFVLGVTLTLRIFGFELGTFNRTLLSRTLTLPSGFERTYTLRLRTPRLPPPAEIEGTWHAALYDPETNELICEDQTSWILSWS